LLWSPRRLSAEAGPLPCLHVHCREQGHDHGGQNKSRNNPDCVMPVEMGPELDGRDRSDEQADQDRDRNPLKPTSRCVVLIE
jgi:hypothetical protein